MKDWAKSFYNSRAWQECRRNFLQQNPFCERCMSEGRWTPAVHVHHKTYLTPQNIGDASVSLNFANLEALCQACHNMEHHRTSRRRYFMDEAGNIIGRD